MRYGKIEGIGKPVSRLILGTAVGRMQQGKDSCEVFDAALRAGINAVDTARCYQRSEKVIGDWLVRSGKREEVVLISKGGDYGLFGECRLDEKHVRADLDRSLSALQTDYVDLYFLHKDDDRRPAGEFVELLASLRAEGKIRTYGVSNWHYTRIEEANEYAYAHNLPPMSASQPQYSLAVAEREPWRGCYSLTGKNHVRERAWYAETQTAILAYCPLGRGLFSGKFTSADRTNLRKAMDGAARRAFVSERNFEILRRAEEVAGLLGVSVSAVALAWLFAREENVFPVVGCGTVPSVLRNLAATEISLTSDQLAYLGELTAE